MIKLIVDAHALIWYVLGISKLSAIAEALIRDPANEILVSTATYWEIAIKVSKGTLQLHQPFELFQEGCELQYGFATYRIESRHTRRVAKLGFPSAHRDPFDRMIVAQSLEDIIPIVSNDTLLDAYGITRLW